MTGTKTKTITRSFIGCKIINAVPMSRKSFEKEQNKEPAFSEDEPGYKVTYPDGYISWSPMLVFENAYREITVAERKLLS